MKMARFTCRRCCQVSAAMLFLMTCATTYRYYQFDSNYTFAIPETAFLPNDWPGDLREPGILTSKHRKISMRESGRDATVPRKSPLFHHNANLELTADYDFAPETVLYDLQPMQQLHLDSILLPYSENFSVAVQGLAARLRKYIELSRSIESWNDTRFTAWRKTVRQHADLENALFPFASGKRKTIAQWRQSFSGRGIVIPACSRFMRFTIALIQNIRSLDCKLPIQVFHNGAAELTVAEKRYLSKLGTKVTDLSTVIRGADNVEGYAMKPYALFFSPFREVILVDADTNFLRNPEELFEDEGYKATGTLFFLDRYYHKYYAKSSLGPTWFDLNLPQPISEQLKQSQIYRGQSNHLLESGVVVIDKNRNAFGALAACRIMTKEENKAWYGPTFGEGDKEAYWLAFELIGEPYTIHPWRPGQIGRVHPNPKTSKPEVCGNIVHPGRDGRPFWLNGGVILKDIDQDVRQFDSFAIEGATDTLRPLDNCLEDVRPQSLNKKEREALRKVEEFWTNAAKTLQVLKDRD